MSAKTSERVDVYTRITNQIVAELENGVLRGASHGTPATRSAASSGRCATMASPTPASTS